MNREPIGMSRMFFPQTSSQLEMELAGRIQDAYLNGDVQNVKLLVERLFTLFRRTKTPPQYVQEFCYSFLLHLNKDFITTFQQLKGEFLYLGIQLL